MSARGSVTWSTQDQIGMPLLTSTARWPEGRLMPWVPGMRTDIADGYLMTWHTGDIRRYYEAGGKSEQLIVHFLSYDTGVIDPLWGDSFHERVARMKELKVTRVVSPDFSSWADSPVPVQMFNYYRSNVVYRDLAKAGFELIPNVCWSHPSLFDFSLLQWGAHEAALIDVNHDWFTGDSMWREAFLSGLRRYHDLHPNTTLAIYSNTAASLAAVKRVHSNSFWVSTRAQALANLQRVGRRVVRARKQAAGG